MFTFFYVVCVRPTFDIIFLNIILHPFISIHASQISHQFRAFYRNGSNGWKPRFRSRTSGIGEVRSTSMLQMMSSSFTQSATRQHQRRCARRILHRNCCVLRYFSARDGVHHPSCVFFFLIIVPMVEYIAPATFYVITLRPCSQWATYLHLSANTYRLWQVSTQHQHQLVTLRLSLQYKLHLDLSLSTSCLETRYQHLLLSTSRLRRLSLSKQHWWHWWGAMPWWDWGFMLCVRVSQKRIWRRVWHSRSSRWDDSKSERTWRAFFGTFVLWVGGSTRWSGRVFMWHVWGWRRHFGMLPGAGLKFVFGWLRAAWRVPRTMFGCFGPLGRCAVADLSMVTDNSILWEVCYSDWFHRRCGRYWWEVLLADDKRWRRTITLMTQRWRRWTRKRIGIRAAWEERLQGKLREARRRFVAGFCQWEPAPRKDKQISGRCNPPWRPRRKNWESSWTRSWPGCE